MFRGGAGGPTRGGGFRDRGAMGRGQRPGGARGGGRSTHLYHWSTVCSWTSAGLIWMVPRKACSDSARSYTLKVTTDCSDVTSLGTGPERPHGTARKRGDRSQGHLVLPHRVVRGYAPPEQPAQLRLARSQRRGRRRLRAIPGARAVAALPARFIVDRTEGGEGGGGGRARDGAGGDALDLLVGLVGGIATNEFVLFELNDDVRTGDRGADVETASLDELNVDLALGWAG